MQINILIVEDNPADVELIRAHFESVAFRFKLIHAASYSEGVEMLKEHNVNLVLLDLSLRDSPWFSTLKNFLREAPNIPVIVMTGIRNEMMGLQSVKNGAQDYLVKGEFDGKRLVQSIQYAFQRFKKQSKLKAEADQLTDEALLISNVQKIAKFATWSMDLVSNDMTWGDEMFNIFGFEVDSFTPSLRDYKEYVHVEDRNIVADFFEETIRTGKPAKAEHRILVNNEVKFLVIQARITYDERSNKIMLVGSAQDVTDQKQSEVKKEPEPQSSLGIKEEALTKLSFSVRTPLSSAMNLVYLLKRSKLTRRQKEFVEDLNTSFEDIYLVINNLLNYVLLLSDSASNHKEEIGLASLLAPLQKVLLLKARQANLELTFKEEDSLPKSIICDSEKVTQAIHNAAILALNKSFPNSPVEVFFGKKMQGKGQVTLQVEVRYAGNELSIQGLSKIMDSKDNWQNLLFLSAENEAYDQLCLFILYKLAELLGGKVDIQSKHAKRNVILLELPFASSTYVSADAQDNKPDTPINILLVEDHVLNQIATRHVLTEWSDMVSVEVAANGAEGVEKFHESRYDVVIMDIEMPIMDGIEAATQIRSQSKIPIIALTANASKQEEERCLGSGMNGYLSKPIKPEELQSQILRVLS